MRQDIYKKNSKRINGFTLIEMVVALGVFSIIAVIVAGALLSMSDAQKKAIALRLAQDNIGYTFETMTKEIRTGHSYHCGIGNDYFNIAPRDCISPGGPSFIFINALGQTIIYRLRLTSGQGQIERSANGGGTFSALTSPEVNVNRLTFYVRGAPENDKLQPLVTIILNGTAGETARVKTSINVQTTISQRLLDS